MNGCTMHRVNLDFHAGTTEVEQAAVLKSTNRLRSAGRKPPNRSSPRTVGLKCMSKVTSQQKEMHQITNSKNWRGMTGGRGLVGDVAAEDQITKRATLQGVPNLALGFAVWHLASLCSIILQWETDACSRVVMGRRLSPSFGRLTQNGRDM